MTDREQSWFFTRRWQEGEKEAEKDILSGRVHSFDNAKKAVAFLHKFVKKDMPSQQRRQPR